jgi:uncharacterized membrane protein (DUF4010 family)
MPPLMLSLIASAGLGAVIGLIRQWSEQAEQPRSTEFAGVRTFTCWSLLGCVAAFLSGEYSPAVLPVVLLIVGAHFVIGNRPAPAKAPPGSTTFVASLLTVLIGALVHWQQHEEAVLLAALLVVLLGLKHPIHAWTRNFTETDIRATLQFVAVTGVILPLVPDRDFGPYDAFNLRSTWMMVVLISGVGFVGYVLMRLLSARAGVVLASLLGGVASSTATTLAFSRRSREDPAHSESYALAVAIACTVMLPRVLVVVGLVSRELAQQLLLPFGIMAVPGVLYGLVIFWRQRQRHGKNDAPVIGNPLSLVTAVKFAAIYAVVAFLVKAASQTGHLQGSLLPLAFVSGLTDLDAISLSVARNLGTGAADGSLAAQAVVVAAISNSILKSGLAVGLGSPTLRWHVAGVMLVTIAAGIGGIVLLRAGGATEGSLAE